MKPVMRSKAMKRVLPIIRRADTDKREQLEKENARLKKFLKLIYENRFEIDKLYLYAERAKGYFTEEE